MTEDYYGDTNPSYPDIERNYAIVNHILREQGQKDSECLPISTKEYEKIAELPQPNQNTEELCYHPASLVEEFNKAHNIYKIPVDMEIPGTMTMHDFQAIARRFEKYMEEIERLIDLEPVANGYFHPIEDVLKHLFNEDTNIAAEMLGNIIANEKKGLLAAAIIKCISRIESENIKKIGTRLAGSALKQKDTEVRDAAVQALESWGNRDAVIILKQHDEKVPWLKEYIDGVIEDIISEE